MELEEEDELLEVDELLLLELDLELEGTYTGKAMAAVIRDLPSPDSSKQNFLFWNTYNSAPLQIDESAPVDPAALPSEFLRYVN